MEAKIVTELMRYAQTHVGLGYHDSADCMEDAADIIAKLPVDAEGNPVAPGATVWANRSARCKNLDTGTYETHGPPLKMSGTDWEWLPDAGWHVSWGGPDCDSVPISICYSTRAAAEAAKGGG